MTVVSGELTVRIADGEWRLYPAGTQFEVAGKSGFDVRATQATAYLCEFLLGAWCFSPIRARRRRCRRHRTSVRLLLRLGGTPVSTKITDGSGSVIVDASYGARRGGERNDGGTGRWIRSTCDLSDRYGDKGRVLPPVFRHFGGVHRFSGTVVTVRCPEDNSRVNELVRTPGEGRVLVVDAFGSMRYALLGDMLGQLATENGWAGVVVTAACATRPS